MDFLSAGLGGVDGGRRAIKHFPTIFAHWQRLMKMRGGDPINKI